MGFKAKKKLYRLTFADDTDMAGLQVTMTSVSMGTLLWLQEMSENGAEVAQDAAAFRKVVEVFVGAMLSWNLEDDDDTPVPVTVDGVLAQDPDFMMSIIAAWTKAISGVTDPLDARSTSGQRSLEASIPMETLSPSPPS
jgi:hypothetical protein